MKFGGVFCAAASAPSEATASPDKIPPARSRALEASFIIAAPSKVRFVGLRNIGVLVCVIFAEVLGADLFHPRHAAPPVCGDGRPRRGEDVRILDRELELEPPAVAGIDRHCSRRATDAAVLFLVPFLRVLRFGGIDQAVTLDEMK